MKIESRVTDITRDLQVSSDAGSVSNRLRSDTSGPSGSASSAPAPREPVSYGKREKGQSAPSLKGIDLKLTVDKLNKLILDQQRDVAFSVDEEANTTVIKVFRTKTGELIKQYPPEEILAMKAKLRKNVGWLIDKKSINIITQPRNDREDVTAWQLQEW